MTFTEIEQVIGGSLPPAADRHRAWWSNNPSNNVMTKYWLAAGFHTERVDMGSRKLVFRRVRGGGVTDRTPSSGRPAPSARQVSITGAAIAPKTGPGLIDRLQAALGGTVHIPEGVDITQPTGEVWDAER